MDWLYHFRSNKNKKIQESLLREIQTKQKIKIFKSFLSKTASTPDVSELSLKDHVVLFVYDDLMKKRPYNSLLKDSKFCGDAYTNFEVNGWYKKENRMPIIMRPQILSKVPTWGKQKNAHAAILKGEIFLVKTNIIYDLDIYYDNGVKFNRERIDITLPFEEDIQRSGKGIPFCKDEEIVIIKSGRYLHKMKVWAYLGNSLYWWGEPDHFAFATRRNNTIGINSIDFVPMPIFTPKKTWKSLYYYHAKYPSKNSSTL